MTTARSAGSAAAASNRRSRGARSAPWRRERIEWMEIDTRDDEDLLVRFRRRLSRPPAPGAVAAGGAAGWPALVDGWRSRLGALRGHRARADGDARTPRSARGSAAIACDSGAVPWPDARRALVAGDRQRRRRCWCSAPARKHRCCCRCCARSAATTTLVERRPRWRGAGALRRRGADAIADAGAACGDGARLRCGAGDAPPLRTRPRSAAGAGAGGDPLRRPARSGAAARRPVPRAAGARRAMRCCRACIRRSGSHLGGRGRRRSR